MVQKIPKMNGHSKALIDLLKGWPNPALLPAAQIKAASAAALSDPSVYTPALLYGPDWGYEPLRERIASWLTDFYQASTIISAGSLSEHSLHSAGILRPRFYEECLDGVTDVLTCRPDIRG